MTLNKSSNDRCNKAISTDLDQLILFQIYNNFSTFTTVTCLIKTAILCPSEQNAQQKIS